MIIRKKKGWANDPNTWSGEYIISAGLDKEKVKRILSGKH